MEHRLVHRKRQNTFRPTISYALPESSSSDSSSTSSTTSSLPTSSSSSSTSSSSSSTSTTSSSSSSSSSSSTSTSSSTSSSSSTLTTTSSTSSSTSSTSSVSTLDVPQTVLVPPTQSTASSTSSTSSASSSSTPGNANVTGAAKTSTGTIVGIVLAVVLGVAILWIAVAFIQRRLRNRARDRYDPDSFMRQSVILPDNESSPVIGTRNALALARANMGLGDPAPGPQPLAAQYDGGATYFAEEPGYASHVYTPSPGYDPSQLTRRPSTGAADMRQMYSGPYPPPSMQQYPYGNTAPMYAQEVPAQSYGSQEQHPNEVHRNAVVSVTPFQEQQYAEISRQLSQPASAHLSNSSGHGQDADDASPFSDPAPSGESTQPLGRTLSRSYGSLSPASPVAPHTTRSGTPVEANPQQTYLTPASPVAHPEPAARPEAPHHDQYNGPVRANVSRETVYEADDAYGGI